MVSTASLVISSASPFMSYGTIRGFAENILSESGGSKFGMYRRLGAIIIFDRGRASMADATLWSLVANAHDKRPFVGVFQLMDAAFPETDVPDGFKSVRLPNPGPDNILAVHIHRLVERYWRIREISYTVNAVVMLTMMLRDRYAADGFTTANVVHRLSSIAATYQVNVPPVVINGCCIDSIATSKRLVALLLRDRLITHHLARYVVGMLSMLHDKTVQWDSAVNAALILLNTIN